MTAPAFRLMSPIAQAPAVSVTPRSQRSEQFATGRVTGRPRRATEVMICVHLAASSAPTRQELGWNPTGRGIAADPNLRPGPIKTVQIKYFNAIREAGLTPDFASALTWDPAMIIIDALRHVGKDATAEQLHSYIEQLHSWPGVCAMYDFRDNGQRGLAQNAMLIYRWDQTRNAFVVPSANGGS